jgi:polyhydroxyalkanoate synthesis regulator phasin
MNVSNVCTAIAGIADATNKTVSEVIAALVKAGVLSEAQAEQVREQFMCERL